MCTRNRFLTQGAVLGVILSVAASAASQDTGSPHLRWRVGQTWTVRVRTPGSGPPRTEDGKIPSSWGGKAYRDVHFEVRRRLSVGENECFEIHETRPVQSDGSQERHLHYYCTSTGTLLMSKDSYLRTDGTVYERVNDHAEDSATIPALDSFRSCYTLGLMPRWDRPTTFQADIGPKYAPRGSIRHGQEITRPAEELRAFMKTGIVCKLWYKMVFPPTGKEDTGSTLLEEVIQEWMPGEPWWRICTSYLNGQPSRKCMLLKDVKAKKNGLSPEMSPGHGASEEEVESFVGKFPKGRQYLDR